MADVVNDPRRPFAGQYVFGIVPDPSRVESMGPAYGWKRTMGELLGNHYNAPALSSYPGPENAAAGAAAAYGTAVEPMLREDAARYVTTDLTDEMPKRQVIAEQLKRAVLAIRRNPIASVGFDPRNMRFIKAARDSLSTAGQYNPKIDKLWYNTEFPDAAVHESMHRGIEQLRRMGLYPKELQGLDEEYIVRFLMKTHAGNPEEGRGKGGDQQIRDADYLILHHGSQSAKYQLGINKLWSAAQQLIAKQHPGGPR